MLCLQIPRYMSTDSTLYVYRFHVYMSTDSTLCLHGKGTVDITCATC